MNLINELQNKKDFSPNEKDLADFILQNSEDVLTMSIRELSEKSFFATSTILRLCKKLGLSGFKEFKIQFSRDLTADYQKIMKVDANTPFSSQDSMIVISRKIAELSKDTIDLTQQLLTDQLLKNAVSLIMNAKRIFAFGVSDSFIKLTDFQLKMLKIGKFVHLVQTQPDQVFLAAHGTQKDVAIVVSYSGTTAEIENIAKIIHKKKIPMIFITSHADCYVASIAKYVIPLPKEENAQTSISSFASQISIAYTLNVLYSCIFRMNYEESLNNRQEGKSFYLHF